MIRKGGIYRNEVIVMLKGNTNLSVNFNVNGIEISGNVKYNVTDAFVEIVYLDKNQKEQIVQRLYNGSLYNKEQMIAEIESLIEEQHLDIE